MTKDTPDTMTSCKRCGTCCMKGGPVLHIEDKAIITEGHIGIEQLITIRPGELAYTPGSEKPQQVQHELVKIVGKGKGWECIFYHTSEAACRIYDHRPLECRLLKCWETAELLSVMCKETLTRLDILGPEVPILALISSHEEKCSVLNVQKIIVSMAESADKTGPMEALAAIVQEDLNIRSKAVSEYGLSLAAELFMFGRPLFKYLGSQGISAREAKGRLQLFLNKV